MGNIYHGKRYNIKYINYCNEGRWVKSGKKKKREREIL